MQFLVSRVYALNIECLCFEGVSLGRNSPNSKLEARMGLGYARLDPHGLGSTVRTACYVLASMFLVSE